MNLVMHIVGGQVVQFSDYLGGMNIIDNCDDNPYPTLRRCTFKGCNAVLSIYNKGDKCFCHPIETKDGERTERSLNTKRPEGKVDESKIDEMFLAVAEVFNITVDQVKNEYGNLEVRTARQVAIYLMVTDFNIRRLSIVQFFKKHYDAFVYHCRKSVSRRLENDFDLKAKVDRIRHSYTG